MFDAIKRGDWHADAATRAEIETLAGAPSSVSGADATRASTTVPRPLVPVAPAPTPNTPAVSGPSASGRDSGYELVPAQRSAERRVGKECVGTVRSRWSPYH